MALWFHLIVFRPFAWKSTTTSEFNRPNVCSAQHFALNVADMVLNASSEFFKVSNSVFIKSFTCCAFLLYLVSVHYQAYGKKENNFIPQLLFLHCLSKQANQWEWRSCLINMDFCAIFHLSPFVWRIFLSRKVHKSSKIQTNKFVPDFVSWHYEPTPDYMNKHKLMEKNMKLSVNQNVN